MRSEWDHILGEHYDRKATEATAKDSPPLDHGDAGAVLAQVSEWLLSYALPGSANPLYRLTVEDGSSMAPPWLRVRFAMRPAAVDDHSDNSTLTFSVKDDVLISMPDLSPCFRHPVAPDALLPTAAELPDLVEVSALHLGWAIEAVQQFVRVALARQ